MTIGPDDTRIAVITFGNDAVLEFRLNTYTDKASILKAVGDVKYTGGQTNTTGAIRLLMSEIFVKEYGDRPKIPNRAVIFTDGAPNIEEKVLDNTVAEAHKEGISTLAIGVTASMTTAQKETFEKALKSLSSPPGELGKDYFKVKTYGELNDVRVELQKQTCRKRS
jgi:Mg-chelatase subunit ChlD